MKKIISLAAFLPLAAFLAFPGISSAQSVSSSTAQLEAEIQSLIAEVQQLELQLTAQEGQTGGWCYNFNNNLRIGDSGADVAALQMALQKDGEEASSTGIFDETTASFVTAFQEKYASVILTPIGLQYGTGYVGAATRKQLNALYGCHGTAAGSMSTSTTSGTSTAPITVGSGTGTLTGTPANPSGLPFVTVSPNNLVGIVAQGGSQNYTFIVNDQSGQAVTLGALPSWAQSSGSVSANSAGLLSMSVSACGLAEGKYTATIPVLTGGLPSSIPPIIFYLDIVTSTVPVSPSCAPGALGPMTASSTSTSTAGSLGLLISGAPSNFSLSVPQGNQGSAVFTITNDSSSSATLSVGPIVSGALSQIISDPSWADVSNVPTIAPDSVVQVSIPVNTSNLCPGFYSGNIMINAGGQIISSVSPDITVTTSTSASSGNCIGAQATMSSSTATTTSPSATTITSSIDVITKSLPFTIPAGRATTSSQPLTVYSLLGYPVAFAGGNNWLTLGDTMTYASGGIQIAPVVAGVCGLAPSSTPLGPGTYTALVAVIGPGVVDGVIPVTLTVTPSSGTAPGYGCPGFSLASSTNATTTATSTSPTGAPTSTPSIITSVQGIDPSSGMSASSGMAFANGILAIYGKQFGSSGNKIFIDGLQDVPIFESQSQINVPLTNVLHGSHFVTVETPDGLVGNATFTIVSSTATAAVTGGSCSGGSVIAGVQGFNPPDSGYSYGIALSGTYLVLYGSKFGASGNTITIDGAPASAIYQSQTQINLSLSGVSTGNHCVSITTPSGLSDSAPFSVTTNQSAVEAASVFPVNP